MRLPHTDRSQLAPLRTVRRGPDNAVLDGATARGSLTMRGFVSICLLVLAGSAMQAHANQTLDALAVAFAFLVSGLVAVRFLFPGGRGERRAFLLTYGVAIFAGGLAQTYSLAVFGDPQSTPDAANAFFTNISPRPPFVTMASSNALLDSTLSVVIWQQVYKLTWLLGFEFGPYTGVMFNSLVMGMTASFTVRAARELYGDDAWRLRRVGTLFAFNGLFVLFGAVLIRDGFTTFLNALVLWGIVRWLARPTLTRLLFGGVLTGLAAYPMVFLRIEVVPLFGLFWVLAFVFWYQQKRLDAKRFLATVIAIGLLLVGSGPAVGYVQSLQAVQASGLTKYNQFSASIDTGSSLGMRLVVNQPLPVRLVSGSVMLMVFPVPLWAYFNTNSADYHWLKGYHGIYQVAVMPLFLAGLFAVYRLVRREREQGTPLAFVAVYMLMSLAAIVTTSLEQRHLAQFMPAFVILAAVPDTRSTRVRIKVQSLAVWWLVGVVLFHVGWATMKVYGV